MDFRSNRLGSALVAAAAAAWIAGCANRPESIHPSFVPFERYIDLECTELDTRLVDMRAELERVSTLQNNKANGDAVGVFLIGVPFSKLSGDHEADVARLKGEVDAIDTARIRKKCRPA